ncbi:MAG: Asp-tRNA(Asn)/Glu-tRNA(Gln) amidotransferase subunit GatB [Anaerolineales bacterium]|nr:Asp-tRNA(Asn)/Glu-tRNA(Gln) amidotransferase subunit GatB [Anaerolineales bacterium]
MSEFEPVIGLEVHAELLTSSKMFCGCEVVDLTTAEPNTAVCEICTGMPGTLPVINERAVEYALRVAVALHCEIAEVSIFARKNYFYPDLPKGFQISQYELPLAYDGWLLVDTEDGEKRIGIRRVHIEEDTGKLHHRDLHSLVDYNRSGIPLLEIVSEPDLHSIDDVRSYSIALRSLLRYLKVNSGDMEKGVIRFEANVSVRPKGSKDLGTRTEIKNLNSFRAMLRALEYEVNRQSMILTEGGQVLQETVGWDEARSITVSQRGKEEAHDYRYFAEPDLPPLHIDPSWVEAIKASLPELPYEKRKRFIKEYSFSPYLAGVLTAEREVADFFEEAVNAKPKVHPQKLANWLSSDLFGLLNEANININESKVSPESFAALVLMVEENKINASSGKVVLAEMVESGGSPADIVDERELGQITDPDVIDRIVIDVLDANPVQRSQYLEGKHALSQWFFGQVMRATGGRADPSIIRQVLDEHLKGLEESH